MQRSSTDTVAAVDCERRVLHTGGQRELAYDALVIAVGARTRDVLPDAVAIDVSRMDESLHGLIEEIDSGSLRSLAFVAPTPTWPLPVYELALLVQEHAREKNVDLAVTIITAEQRPLAVFGESVSAGVAGILADADIQMIVGARVESSSGELVVHPGEHPLRFDRVVALPRLVGPAITGLPADARRIPADHAALRGVRGRARVCRRGRHRLPRQVRRDRRAAGGRRRGIDRRPGRRTDRAPPFDGVVHGALMRAASTGVFISLPVSKEASHETRGPARHRPPRPRRRSPRDTSGPTWTSCGRKDPAGSPASCRYRLSSQLSLNGLDSIEP